MNYKYLFKELDISEKFNYAFCFTKNEVKGIKSKNIDNDFLNNLAFAPVTLESKENIYIQLIEGKLSVSDQNRLTEKLDIIYEDFNSNINTQAIKIREYIKFIFDWIVIQVKLRGDDNYQIEVIKDSIGRLTNNKLIVFYLIHRFYTKNLYKQTVELISFIFKQKLFTLEDDLYNDLLLYKLISLKGKNFEYLDNHEVVDEICKITQNLYGFDYVKIITLFECRLINNDNDGFVEVYNKHFDIFSKWSAGELLNIYELAVYSKIQSLILTFKSLLESKDIELIEDTQEYYNTYKFLNAVADNEKNYIEKYGKILKRFDWNFNHYNYFKNKIDERF